MTGKRNDASTKAKGRGGAKAAAGAKDGRGGGKADAKAKKAGTAPQEAARGADTPADTEAGGTAGNRPATTPPPDTPAAAPRNRWAGFFGLEADLPPGRPAGPPALGDIGRGYIASLARAGKGPGTLLSYQLDLSLVLRVLGEDTPAESITEEAVAACFESDAVTRTRTGAPKAKVGIDKTRRVLRQALDWAAAEGLIPASPVPGRYRARKGAKPAKAAKPAGEEAR